MMLICLPLLIRCYWQNIYNGTLQFKFYQVIQLAHILFMAFQVKNILVIVALLMVLSVTQQIPKLIYVQQVFRHGARYPIYPSKLDNSYYAAQQRSAGQLTKQGKSMHYILGQKIYAQYWQKLFPKNSPFYAVYNQSKFYVKSTDVNRTIESVQSHLAGIFENLNPLTLAPQDYQFSVPQWPNASRTLNDVFVNLRQFNPVPVHVQKGPMSPWDNGDFLRTYAGFICYKMNQFEKANKQDYYIKEIINHPNITRAIEALSTQLKQNVSFSKAAQFYDNAQTMKYMRQPGILPIFTQNSDNSRALDTIYRLDMYINLFFTEEQLKITATGYFNQTVNHFKRVVANQEGVQWAIYSAHDTTVGNYLARIGLTSVKCIYDNFKNGNFKNTDTCIVEYPSYTSNLIFEVYQYSNNTNTFKIRYNGQYRKIPFCDWNTECSVQSFYSWYDSWKDEDYVKHCGVKNSKAETMFSLFIVALGIVFIFAIVSILNYLNKKHKKQEQAIINDQAKTKLQKKLNGKIQNKSLGESLISEQY